MCESVDNLDNVSVLDSINRLLRIIYCHHHDHHCICHSNHLYLYLYCFCHLDCKVLPVGPLDDPPVVHILVCVARNLVMMTLMMMTTKIMMMNHMFNVNHILIENHIVTDHDGDCHLLLMRRSPAVRIPDINSLLTVIPDINWSFKFAQLKAATNMTKNQFPHEIVLKSWKFAQIVNMSSSHEISRIITIGGFIT